MARLIFGKILSEAIKDNVFTKTREIANQWYIRKTSSYRGNETNITTLRNAESQKLIRGEMLGNLYFFGYEPVYKDKLKYWDAFPLTLIMELTQKGFLGINFHYLPYRHRAYLMDELMELERKNALSERAGVLEKRLITYHYLSSFTRYKYFKPALKHYHFNNITTRMVELNKAEWKIALFLPVDDFQKENSKTVWDNTKKQLRENR